MEWFNKLKASQVMKMAGLALVAIIVLAALVSLIGSAVNGLRGRSGSALSFGTSSVSPGAADYYLKGEMAEEAAYDLSARNVAGSPQYAVDSDGLIRPPYGGGTTGSTAEQFEVTDYRASLETRQLADTCGQISGLKAREDVIFENSSEYDRGCDYTFKVKQASAAEILGFINALDPEELVENTRTIKDTVDDFTSQTEILNNKLAAINETMAQAIRAYDEVTALATRTQNAESLAKIIDSKVNIIERLTQERINISSQLEYLGRAKAEQLDRLEYTYFYVNVRENKYIDGQSLKDSWRGALRNFVEDVNRIAQDISVNLVTWLLLVIQYVIYFLILLVIAKYVWQFAKRIWRQ